MNAASIKLTIPSLNNQANCYIYSIYKAGGIMCFEERNYEIIRRRMDTVFAGRKMKRKANSSHIVRCSIGEKKAFADTKAFLFRAEGGTRTRTSVF